MLEIQANLKRDKDFMTDQKSEPDQADQKNDIEGAMQIKRIADPLAHTGNSTYHSNHRKTPTIKRQYIETT